MTNGNLFVKIPLPYKNPVMMSSNKWLPLALILLGSTLILTLAVFSIFGFPQPNAPPNPNLPQSLANLPLSKQLAGSEAVAEFTQLHGKSLAVTSGVKGTYGEWGAITLWVAGADSAEEIQDLLVAMEEKIAQGKFTIYTRKNNPTWRQNDLRSEWDGAASFLFSIREFPHLAGSRSRHRGPSAARNAKFLPITKFLEDYD